MTLDLTKFQKALPKLEKLSCPYSGKKLSPDETRKMVEHLTIKPYKNGSESFIPEIPKKDFVKKMLEKIDKAIAKDPKDIELRKYRSAIAKMNKEIIKLTI